MKYQLWARERNGGRLGLLTDARSRRFSYYLNRPCEASFELPATSAQAAAHLLRPGVTELEVSRGGELQETMFAVTAVRVQADADQMVLDVAAQGILTYLADGLVYGGTSVSSATTAAAHAWGLVSTFQARTGGSYGLTEGTHQGTPYNAGREYGEDQGILDSIVNLSETSAATGFDFRIDPLRRFIVHYGGRGEDRGLRLEYGSAVTAFSYEEDAGPGVLASDVRVSGGLDAALATASNSAARTLYGRREASIIAAGDIDVSSAFLQSTADAIIADRAAPVIVPELQLRIDDEVAPYGSYWLGDTVRFVARVADYAEIDADYRIVAIHVDVDDDDREQIRLELNAA